MDRREIRIAILAAALALRGCVNGAFGAWLILGRPGWTNVFQAGAIYAIADGVVGLITVVLIVSLTPGGLLRLLAAMTCVDAIGRLAAGIALRAFPGIPHVPMTIVPFFAALGAGVAGLGMIGMMAWLVARTRGRRTWSRSADTLFDPLAAAALVSFVVGFVLFANPPATADVLRTVAASATGALALVFLTASLGAIAHNGFSLTRS
jgi:hypothetical protein